MVAAALRSAAKPKKPVALAARKKKKWSLGDIFVPGVEGVTFHEGTHPSAAGVMSAYQADPDARTIYADPAVLRGKPDEAALGHEMGHMLNPYMTPDDQTNFVRLMGLSGGWQDPLPGGLAWNSPMEQFGDWYSLVANHVDPRGKYQGGYLEQMPTRKQLRRFAIELAKFGRRNQLGAYKAPTWP